MKRAAGKRAAKRTGAPRARRGEKRQAILNVVSQHLGGLTREILNLMGMKGTKSGEQSDPAEGVGVPRIALRSMRAT